MDGRDPLGRLRDRFSIRAGLVYLDGNSLGALPKTTASALLDVVDRQWGEDLIGSWNANGWMQAPARVGGKIARLIGAQADEVIVADSTTVNLFKLVQGALRLREGRTTILTEPGNFPTDLHVLEGVAAGSDGGVRVKRVARAALADAIDERTALVMLTHVHYKSAEIWPMAEITARAHAAGALVLWDLSHSAGALRVDLGAAGADLAVGCGYKHLNGGPGAPSFVFVARGLQEPLFNPIWGWLGHAAPFDFGDEHQPAAGIARQLCGTPPILALAALECGVESFDGVDMAEVEAKARGLGELFRELVQTRCAGHGLTLASPVDPNRRGAHIAFAHPDGYALIQALIARGVIGDFRAPDILRFGFTALYLRHVDVWDAVEALRQVLEAREHERPEFRQRQAVT
jgi:kynureninase